MEDKIKLKKSMFVNYLSIDFKNYLKLQLKFAALFFTTILLFLSCSKDKNQQPPVIQPPVIQPPVAVNQPPDPGQNVFLTSIIFSVSISNENKFSF